MKTTFLNLAGCLLIFAGISVSCLSKEPDKPQIYTSPAMVIASDNCGYIIAVPIRIDGTDFDIDHKPHNLPDEYKVDSLKVNVTYSFMSDSWICENQKALVIIDLISIRKR